MDCLFCKIAKKDVLSEIIYEDLETVAFLDINPRSAGHTVVIPKIHADNILDLRADKISPVFSAVKKATAIIKNALKPDGFTIGINHGRVSGQSVDHLHIHIIPRFNNDGGGSVHSVVDNPPKESLKEIADRIKKYE